MVFVALVYRVCWSVRGFHVVDPNGSPHLDCPVARRSLLGKWDLQRSGQYEPHEFFQVISPKIFLKWFKNMVKHDGTSSNFVFSLQSVPRKYTCFASQNKGAIAEIPTTATLVSTSPCTVAMKNPWGDVSESEQNYIWAAAFIYSMGPVKKM